MQIKRIYPTVTCNDVKHIMDAYLNSGFKVIHEVHNIMNEGDTLYVIENDLNQRIDIVETNKVSGLFHMVRINVDNFDEALAYYTKKGFKAIKEPIDTISNKGVCLESPTGLYIMMFQHNK